MVQYPETYIELQTAVQKMHLHWSVTHHQISIGVSVQGGLTDDENELATISTNVVGKYKVDYTAADYSDLAEGDLQKLTLMLDHFSRVPLSQRGPRSKFERTLLKVRAVFGSSKLHKN